MKCIDELVRNGKFTPLIDRLYKLDEIREAYKYVLSGQKMGNVIIFSTKFFILRQNELIDV